MTTGSKFAKFNHKQSFTIVELMVSVAIINVIVFSAIGIYMLSIGSRQKAISQATLQQEGQYIMSLMAKDIRFGRIDYSAYGGTIPSPTGDLILFDLTTTPLTAIRYYREVSSGQYFLKKIVGVNPAQAVTANDLSVERLDFYISPTTDPFTHGSTVFENPRVTIVIKLKAIKERPGQRELILQQTIPQRWEERR